MRKVQNENEPLKKIRPKTENQVEFLRSICENTVTLCEGPAGTGKTMLAIYIACEHLLAGKIKEVLITRTIVSCGKDLGSLPGDIDEKTEIYFSAQLEYLELFLGRHKLDEYLRFGQIKLLPVEILRGSTFRDCVMICDEVQNLTLQQIILFMSRIGMGSRIIMIGDTRQSDTNEGAYSFCLNKLDETDDVGIVRFNKQDIMRHSIIGNILEKLEQN